MQILTFIFRKLIRKLKSLYGFEKRNWKKDIYKKILFVPIFCLLNFEHKFYTFYFIFKKFASNFQKSNGLKAYFEILKDEKFIKIAINTTMNPFNSVDLSLLHYILLAVSALSKYSHDFLYEWKELNAVNTIFNVIKLDSTKQLTCFLIIVNICDDKQIETITEFHSILETFRDFIKTCATDFKNGSFNRDTRYMYFNNELKAVQTHTIKIDKVSTALTNILKAIYKLALNDKFRTDFYFDHHIKEDLKVILLKGNEFEFELALDIFIQLSFNERIAQDLANDEEIKKCIVSSNQKAGVKNKLDTLNWNIYKKSSKSADDVSEKKEKKSENNEKMSENNEEKSEQQKHIMISYNTGSRELILKIKEKLEAFNFKIWIDVNDIHGSSLESMAGAIENSFVVLICVSERYRESINCQAEAQYAFKIKKPIIPCIMQKGYENVSGWLGILMGDKIFVNFTKYSFDECIKRLKHEVDSKIVTNNVISTSMTQVEVKTTNVIPQAENMTESQVQEWFKTNQLDPLILKSFGGTCNGLVLKQIWEIKQRDPPFYDQSLKTIPNINIFSIVKYSAALEKLFSD